MKKETKTHYCFDREEIKDINDRWNSLVRDKFMKDDYDLRIAGWIISGVREISEDKVKEIVSFLQRIINGLEEEILSIKEDPSHPDAIAFAVGGIKNLIRDAKDLKTIFTGELNVCSE